jgi:hypothetical protein
MWIAKPLQHLSGAERAAWIQLQAELQGKSPCSEIPLSQTLAWGEAVIALGGKAYLVFSPDEKVGGLVHSVDGGLESINGPYLHWDHRASIARQFATFAMAMAKLSPEFSFLRIQPRWLQGQLQDRLGNLPIPPREVFEASTLQVRVRESETERLAAVTPRLRRSLSVARRSQVQVQSWDAVGERLTEFAHAMKTFGKTKGFYVPEMAWLQGLIYSENGARREDLRFLITDAKAEGSRTQLLTCIQGNSAHYLLGYDQREDSAKGSVSTAAAAHFHVLSKCAEQGIATYDLNGFTDPSDLSHPYAGVSQFKSQFRGEVLRYASPQFWIEN